MKQIIRDYFTFSSKHRRGVLFLLLIIFLIIIYLTFSYKLFPPDKEDFSKLDARFKSFSDSLLGQKDSLDVLEEHKGLYIPKQYEKEKTISNGERFNFNPNNLSDEEWKRLGLSDKQIKVIHNYEEKGGKFKTKGDVKKMYCIKEEQYLSLEPYISIPKEEKRKFVKDSIANSSAKATPAKVIEPIVLVEINSADSLELITIHGIKGFYAKEIIKYRKLLGGFVSKEQLFELYKFDTLKYNMAEKYIAIDVSQIKKININTCTDKELKHPYLKWNAVKAIINYRKAHGKFKTIDEIKKTDLVDDETYRKIVPYLKTE
jgi:hypothetical protein